MRPPHRAAAGLALGAGAALYAVHPPLDLGVVAGPVALVPLLALARVCAGAARPVLAGLGWGLVAGVAGFAPMLAWLRHVELIAWVALVPVVALWVAAFTAGLAWWGERPARPLVAALGWVAVEAQRSAWPLGGFTWGVLGYSQHLGGPFLGVARTLGVLGVSLVLALLAALIEQALAGAVRWHRARRGGGRPSDDEVGALWAAVRVPAAAAAVVALAAVLLAGEPPEPDGGAIDVAGVQGNDVDDGPRPRDLEGEASRRELIVDRMLAASEPLADDPPDLVVWPENSLDRDAREGGDAALRSRVLETQRMLGGTPLLAGMIADVDGPATHAQGSDVWNAKALFDADGRVADLYAKRQLVPFGEQVPMRDRLGWVEALERVRERMVPGTEPGVMQVDRVGVGPVICFENAYGHLVHDQVRDGAQVLVVSTNNAPFGRGPMSDQHLAFSRLRAVETGRWVVHAGISGRSAIIDPEGRSSQETGLYEQGLVRADLPTVTDTTPAVQLAGWVGPAAWAGLLALLGVALADRRGGGGRGPAGSDGEVDGSDDGDDGDGGGDEGGDPSAEHEQPGRADRRPDGHDGATLRG